MSLFARCKVGFDYFLAKEYYNMSGIKLEQVLLRHAKRDSEEDLVRVDATFLCVILTELLLPFHNILLINQRMQVQIYQKVAQYLHGLRVAYLIRSNRKVCFKKQWSLIRKSHYMTYLVIYCL